MIYPTLPVMRDRGASTAEFRRASDELALTLRDAALDAMDVVNSSVGGDVALLPILRAGLALLPAFTTALLGAEVGFYGIERDEETALPRLYYEKLPAKLPSRALILDPMLATAGSARLAVERLVEAGLAPEDIYFAGVLAAPIGVERLASAIPRRNITLAAIDDGLDERNFIEPGLGDYGDRYFGT